MHPPSDPATRPVLREGRMIDAAACVALWVAACADRDGYAHPGVAERAEPKFASPAAFIVAEQPETHVLAGFALATPPGSGAASDPPGAALLGLIAVAPGQQGSGLGRELLTAATAALARRGYEQAALHVLTDNAAAVRLYEAAGWTKHGPTFEHSLLRRPFQTYLRDFAEGKVDGQTTHPPTPECDGCTA